MSETRHNQAMRWLKLVHMIAARPGKTALELADELGVSRRTIYRDISALEDLGIPLFTQDGYRMASDAYLPVMNFTPLELLAILVSARFLQSQSAPRLGGAMDSAVEKIQRKLPERLQPLLRAMEDRIHVNALRHMEADNGLGLVCSAILEQRRVEFLYSSVQHPHPQPRVVDPWGVFYREGAWYLTGFDHLRQERRTFRLSRLTDLTIQNETFPDPEEFRAENVVFHPWDLEGGEVTLVTVSLSQGLYRWLEENPAHPSQHLSRVDDRGVVSFRVSNPARVAHWVLGLDGAAVLDPGWLVETVVRLCEGKAERHRRAAPL